LIVLADLIQELKEIREGAGVYDASSYGHLLIEGVDAAPFLQRMLTHEVTKLPVGEGRYNALLDRKGMVLSLFYLYRLGEQRFYAVTPPQLTAKTLGLLAKMKVIEKMTLTDESQSRGLLFLIGSKAESLLPKAGGDFLIWKEEIFGPPLWNVSGEREKIKKLYEDLSSQATPLSAQAIRLMRMKIGFPEYGVDIDETHILLEANVPYAYQRQKGCYPGQEVIERILAYGKGRTPKNLCTLTLSGEHEIKPKTEIFAATSEKAGIVTSSLYDPLDQKTVVLAYLDHKYVEGASNLTLEGRAVSLGGLAKGSDISGEEISKTRKDIWGEPFR
jgi:folate-binding protein YgfZ